MIVSSRGGGRRELRMPSPVAPDRIPTPAEFGTWLSSVTGERITSVKAAGIPAVLNAIRLVAESTGSLPLRVYEGEGADKKASEQSWQWRLLHDRPNDEQSPFDFWHDVAASVESYGNAYLLKDVIGGRTSSQVVNLYQIDPQIVQVTRDRRTFTKLFVVRNAASVPNQDVVRPGYLPTQELPQGELRLTAAEVLHIRGPTLSGGDVGYSPIQMCPDALGATLARQKYEASAYRNDATPASVIEVPDKLNRDSAADLLRNWYYAHSDIGQTGKTGLLTNGATLKTYGLTMRDAQFVESHRYSVEDIARMFDMPPSLLGTGEFRTIEQDTRRFLAFGLNTRLKRICAALRHDEHLFAGSGLYPEHFTRDFIQLDAQTDAEIRIKEVQAGIKLPDEARAELGMEPLPDGAGKVPQIVPVGGAPNPNAPPPPNGNGATPSE